MFHHFCIPSSVCPSQNRAAHVGVRRGVRGVEQKKDFTPPVRMLGAEFVFSRCPFSNYILLYVYAFQIRVIGGVHFQFTTFSTEFMGMCYLLLCGFG